MILGDLPAALQPLFDELDRWVEHGWLRELDRSFAAFLARQVPDADRLLILAAALASHQLGRGHVCLDLAATLQDAPGTLSLPPEGREPAHRQAAALPAALLGRISLSGWLDRLADPRLVSPGEGDTPLVLAGTRLYLRRYWAHEQTVRRAIAERVRASEQTPALARQLSATLAALFGRAAAGPAGHRATAHGQSGGAAEAPDWQRIACALAMRQRFCIITGGPGTGKTTTVVRLLAVLQSLALARPGGRPLRIRLAAPTGKAAARLNASIARAVADLPLDALDNAQAVRAEIPTQVGTVHRLLGSRPDTRRFRHHAGNRLALDVLVVDEASMLDLEMAAALFDALPGKATLILLGDKDQLASVEAGAVLGDLCRRADGGHYTPPTAQWLRTAAGQAIDPAYLDPQGTALDQAIVKLRVSHRFRGDSGIGQLADAVNAGDARAARQVLQAGYPDLAQAPAGDDAAFAQLVVEGGLQPPAQGQLALQAEPAGQGYGHYLRVVRAGQPPADAPQAAFDQWAARVLAAHAGFQLLCALREGPQGVSGLNQAVEAALAAAGLIAPDTVWYPGRPVLVTRNDYGLGLMNGDVGVTLALPLSDSQGRTRWAPRVAFAAGDGSGAIRWVLPSRLHAVETVYAMTVHKSQGSEFAHAALLLPERAGPGLTRELLYTGITRARQRFTLIAAPAVLQEAVRRKVARTGGLAGPLFGHE
ncbi:exodeoxyribonuclease V subunit alpha [Orrella sp. JC864]|uniref:exodeoxyribonuclease V subunit alpha n=1 Tax=Orrella sp. JC864 TaxID=3120298 RepID=UPI00300BB2CE